MGSGGETLLEANDDAVNKQKLLWISDLDSKIHLVENLHAYVVDMKRVCFMLRLGTNSRIHTSHECTLQSCFDKSALECELQSCNQVRSSHHYETTNHFMFDHILSGMIFM